MQGVRAARAEDAEAIAQVQIETWRRAYADVLPREAVEQITSAEALMQWRHRWEEAALLPPSPRHRVLVAFEDGAVVGFAALQPAADEDRDPDTEAELLTLLVDPERARCGHGSRLLAASVDHLRDDGFTVAVTWVLLDDEVTRHFFQSAGWGPDGTRRDLDMGDLVREVRLHTALTEEGA
ncbi:MAG: GNAT family N-acetyltransferase [Streptosporangiaceae bacterium]